MPSRNVIIGGGPAGTHAVDTLRRLDPSAEITLVCDEPAYARMALPYYLAGSIPVEQTITGTPEYFRRQRVMPLFGQRAAALDTAAKVVTLAGGARLPYDNLLLATGSRAPRPPVPGADLDGVVTLWTLEDANEALGMLPVNAEVCIAGAGFIGCILLNALQKRGCRIRVVEAAPQVLPRMLDSTAAALVERWLAQRGVRVFTGQPVTRIEGAGRKRVLLSGGEEIEADLVVLATGVVPSVDLARAAGVEVRTGVLIDRQCRTSAPGVHAAGDCAEGPDLLTGEPVVHAIQPTAVDHGRVAGANMAARPVEYPGSLAMNVLDVCGLQCASFGDWAGRDATVVRSESQGIYRKLVWDDDRLTGAIFTGPADDVCMLNDVGMVKGFIQSRACLGHWKRYVQENPTDLRRAYIGAGIPQQLIPFQLLAEPSVSRGYRHRERQPDSDPGMGHSAFTGAAPPPHPR